MKEEKNPLKYKKQFQGVAHALFWLIYNPDCYGSDHFALGIIFAAA